MAACLKEGVLEMLTEFHIIMKSSACEDPHLFHLICHYSMCLGLMEPADELNGNIAIDSFSLQDNVPVMFQTLVRNSETLPC